tara:strand:+ start:1617 stop:2354 length:738 start_codon:yes stop_codon:yes gene_type:complete
LNPTCVIVPVYNHPHTIGAVSASVTAHGLPCLLVDDGSDTACAQRLEELQRAQTTVHLLRLPHNRGKGAAVCAGLRWARDQGYTHALQVDADGQHDLADIPRFLDASARDPQAVITGSRRAQGISALRHYGRKVTDWLVWLETLSTQIDDSMCGYRLYPLAATVALLDATRVGQRMDFDTDILVRLHWRGVAIAQVTTQVIYRRDIPSHFRMLRDNLRIARMHTLLIAGMLPRAPLLLWRRWRDR